MQEKLYAIILFEYLKYKLNEYLKYKFLKRTSGSCTLKVKNLLCFDFATRLQAEEEAHRCFLRLDKSCR